MNTATAEQTLPLDSVPGDDIKSRSFSSGYTPSVLGDIYQKNINIAIWQRTISEHLKAAVDDFIHAHPRFETAMTVSPCNAQADVGKAFGAAAPTELVDNVAELVDMFCCLFELKRTGLRLATLNHAMCPRFHVDQVPCRLVTTCRGVATEWLSHQAVNRSKLGSGNNGQPDAVSGLFNREDDIQQLT